MIYPDDREYFREHFSRQAILNKVMNNEIFMMTYRLLFGFAVISRGEDYTKIDHLMEKLAEENKKLHAAGLPAIHSGMARYQSERSTEDLYLKAKENMEILHQNVMKTRETDS